ncbi:MAG TPA: PHB depolymerase family esterase [Polyangiales bacterium]|nr:PHB depolymerase family esterase [Polyangiales bacterium]
MNKARFIAVSLLLMCIACNSAQPMATEKMGSPSVAEATDAGAQPSAPAVMQPPAAKSRPQHDAGSQAQPKVERRAHDDAAVSSAKDSSVDQSEPVCVPARDLPAAEAELEIAGTRRLFSMHVPAKLPSDRAVPLLVDLHGLMKHARYQRANSGFAQEADRAGFVVVYPQAVDNAWNLGVADCCGVDSAHDDVDFIRALVTKLQQSACVDSEHIYIAGSDVGGGMAQQLACRASDLFAAAVTRDFDFSALAADSCEPSRPVPILALRSENDPDLPYAGGEVRLSSGLNTRVRMLGAEASLSRWAELNQCNGDPDTSTPNCQRYTACKDASEVALCTRANPRAPEDATAAWAFLQRF